MTDLRTWLPRGVDAIAAWQEQYGAFATHPSLQVSDEALADAFGRLVERLHDNYPFGHPRYVGQMLKPPHPAAVLGYTTAMLINPNNHALDGGPATAQMEKEVVARIAAMFGLPQHLGHLTSSGTIANLEALWVARESHPGKAIAYSADAHYTHSRMCGVLGVEGIAVRVDAAGRMDLDHLDEVLATGRVGTVVATVGTTGLGALDPVGEIVARARAAGARVHVDTAYGGFFALVADDSADGVASAPYAAIARADSVVVDIPAIAITYEDQGQASLKGLDLAALGVDLGALMWEAANGRRTATGARTWFWSARAPASLSVTTTSRRPTVASSDAFPRTRFSGAFASPSGHRARRGRSGSRRPPECAPA